MIIPEKVRIIGFDWNVKKDAHVAMEGQIFGSTHTNSQTIFLDPGTTQQKNEQTFFHELLHAIAWQTGLSRRLADDKREEEIIQSLAFGLYQVLVDNGMLK